METKVRDLLLSKFGLSRDIAVVFSGQVISALGGFFVTTLAAKHLGPMAFGDFAFFVACTLIVARITDFGLSRAMVRFSSIHWGKNEPERAHVYYRAVFQIKFLVGMGLLLLLPVLRFFRYGITSADLLGAGLIGGFLFSLTVLATAIFQSEKRFLLYALASSFLNLSRFALLLLLILLHRLTTRNLITVFLITPVLFLLGFSLFLPVSSIGLFKKVNFGLLATLWRFTKWLMVSTVFEGMYERANVLVLKWLSNSKEVGIYAGAFVFTMISSMISASVNALFFPQVSRLVGTGDLTAVRRQYVITTDLLGLIGFPAIMASYSFLPDVAVPLLGSQYTPSVQIFAWLVPYCLFMVVQFHYGAVYMALNRTDLVAKLSVLLAAVILLFDILLVPRFGAQGAALAASIGMGCSLIVSWIMTFRLLGVVPKLGNLLIYLGTSIGISLILRYTHLGSGWLYLLWKLGLGILLYTIVLFLESVILHRGLRAKAFVMRVIAK